MNQGKVLRGILAFAAAMLATSGLAHAEGTFRLSMNGRLGFSILGLKEVNGVRQGTLDGMPVYSERLGNELTMSAGNQTDVLTIDQDRTRLIYEGRFWDQFERSRLDYYPDKNGFMIVGEIAAIVRLQISVDTKKGDLYMWWTEPSGISFTLYLRKTSATEPGSCKGNLVGQKDMETIELAKFFCKSTGELEDMFFKNPDDIIAWMVRFYVDPEVRNSLLKLR